MKISPRITRSLVVITLLLATAIVAQAQAVVYVTANRGSDLNPCTRTSPCRNITRGLNVVAAGGTVEILETGDYTPFTITKSATVEAAQGVNAVIVVPTTAGGITVQTAATTDKVVLRGLTVQGVANGSSVSGNYGIIVGAELTSLHIENCVVTGMGDFGIFITAVSRYYIKDSMIRNNSNNGIYFAPPTGSTSATVEHCRIEDNGNHGILVNPNSIVTVRDSVAAGNNGSGFNASGSAVILTVDNCLSTRNIGDGVTSGSSAIVRVINSTLVNNTGYGLLNYAGSTLYSTGNNRTGGNGSGRTNGTISTAEVN